MTLRALIPAAGRGVRTYPKTVHTPKVLLPIDGKPILQWNVEMLRDQLGIRDITVIIGYEKEQIRDFLCDGSRFGISVRYVECPDPDVGLARGVLLARSLFSEPFVTILGDELYLDSNHRDLTGFLNRPFRAVCGVRETTELHQIKQNYSVRIDQGRITALVEKPSVIENNLLGCGTYLFTPDIFEAISGTPPSERSGRVELTDAINALVRHPDGVRPFFLNGFYSNVNSVDQYNLTQYEIRTRQFAENTISVVIPAKNEEGSIAHVVRDFKPLVDEVFVVDNASTDETARVAREAGARVETVNLKGYGDTIRYGLDHAQGRILVITEADFSFRARDLNKILEYLKDSDMVVGTRTTRQMTEQGTNMRGVVRWANVLVAKLIEALWWSQEPRFTDVGCTYRALWKDTYRTIRPLLGGVGPELSPEMMMSALQTRQRIIEIPVCYHARIGGESKHSANYYQLGKTALRMLRVIARKRLGL